jgi:predicted DNA-binding protein
VGRGFVSPNETNARTAIALTCAIGVGTLAYMKRTTVKLPNDLDAKLRHKAARRGSTIAEVTREAIEAHVGGVARRRLIAAKAGRSGRSGTARHIEEIIRQEAGRSR